MQSSKKIEKLIMKISLSTVVANLAFTVASVVVSVVALTTPMAHATPIQNSTGLSGMFQTETFDTNLGNDSAAASQFAGIHFSNGAYLTNFYSGLVPNALNSSVVNFANNSCPVPVCPAVTITFDNIQSAVAFAFLSGDGTSTFSAYMGSLLVESFTATTLYATGGTFYGFDGINFDSVVIQSASNNNAFLIDNFQTKNASAVPLPGSIALILIGAMGVLGTRGSRAKRTAIATTV
jgi:hypothetical protein